MGGLFTATFMAALISGAILAGMPLLLAALGETVSERAGVLNIGLEGMMLGGALTAYVVSLRTGSPWLGLLGAMVVGALTGLLFAVVVISFRANHPAVEDPAAGRPARHWTGAI